MSSVIYRFRTADTSLYEYTISVEPEKMDHSEDACNPAWAELTFHQCPNCTLSSRNYSHCPVAIRLPPLIEMANKLNSYDRIMVDVELSERRIIQETTAQRALSSLLGLVMATSECPHMAYLQPMARFHLPLASEEETEYRAVSMYLLAQYYRNRQGHAVDFSLTGLTKIYQELQRVNMALADRIRAASSQDTARNAIVLLDMFAKVVPYSVEEAMQEFKHLFVAYLEAPDDNEQQSDK